jgi:multidrug efflux pump subunit AcrB
MWIVRLALRRPYTVATFCLAILLMGILSILGMDVDIFPSINIPVVVVVWNYPGLSAEDMERRITFVSERGISTSVAGITKVESQSINSTSVIKVYFEPSADIGGAIAQISAASLSATRIMPPGTQPPVLLRFNASNVPVAQLTVSGKGQSEQQLFDYGLNFLRLRLFTIPGLSTPAPYGGRQRQVTVDIDPSRVAAEGLAPQDVVNAVLNQNVILPAGSARIGRLDYDVLLNGSPGSTTEFNRLPIKVVNGATVFLGDVANVYDGFAIQQNIVRVNGERATYLAILKKEDASTLAVVDATKDLLPMLRASAPEGTELKLDFDQSTFVRGAVTGVFREALIASALVALMVLAFVGSWRSTVIVCLSIPLAILVGVIGLKLSGQTLNLMTLGGMALAIGMLVDDAIVEIENINRNRSQGKELTVAILDGARQIATPALAATLTICIVFFPVVFLVGAAKYLFIPLALAVVFSMLASYLLSRTLVPTLSHLILGKDRVEPGPAQDAQPSQGGKAHADEQPQAQANAAPEKEPEKPSRFEKIDRFRRKQFERLEHAYAGALAVVLTHRKFVLAMAGAFVVVSSLLVLVVGLDFFPSVDAGIMRLHFRAPSGTRLEETERLVDKVEHRIREVIPEKELETLNDNIGVPISYNLGFVPTDNVNDADAEILVALTKSHTATRIYQARIRDALRQEFPSSFGYFQAADIVSQVLNFGESAPVDVQIEGTNAEAALGIARKLRSAISRIPGAEDVRIAQVLNHPSLLVDVDRERAAELGLSERDVASSLLTSLGSSSLVSPSFWVNPSNNVNYSVVVETPLSRITDLAEVMGTPVTPSAANPLADPSLNDMSTSDIAPAAPQPVRIDNASSPYLGGISTARPTVDRGVINHYTVQPVLDVQCNVEGRDLGSVARNIQSAIDAIKRLPKGVSVHLRGQSETMYSSFKSLGLGLLIAISLVYLLMVVLFQSWLDPLIIMIAVPGAMSGILWMLTATRTTLNVESLMGAIMAVGIAVSNSILLVNFANDRRMEHEEVTPEQAAFAAGRVRLRPVLMTALAMVIGMLPMALGLGEGGEQNAPLGRAVIGGLLCATFVTLFVVPCAYAVLRKKQPDKGRRDRDIAEADQKGERAHAAGASQPKEATA